MINLTDNRNAGLRSGRPGFGPQNSCVVIDTYQVFDSCRDRDCFEDVRVYLDDLGQSIIEHTSQVRTKSAEICGSSIAVEPVQLSRGFYRVTVRFYVKLELEGCLSAGAGCGCQSRAQSFYGIAAVEKSVVLYGGEGSVHVFRSSAVSDGFCASPVCGEMGSNLPVAIVETVNPVILGTRVVEPEICCCKCCCSCCDIPSVIVDQVGHLTDEGARYLAVSLGFFSVIRIERPEQYLINACEYSVPDKECTPVENSSPCDAFRRMAFPTEEFAPGRGAPVVGEICHDHDKDCGCGK